MKDDGQFGRDGWAAISSTLDGLAESVILGDKRITDDAIRTEGYRYLTRIFATGALWEIELDAKYPALVRQLSPWLNVALPHPDAGYLQTMLHGDFGYRIWGTRGTSHLFDVSIHSGDLSDMAVVHQTAHCRQFKVGPNGEFELFLGGERRGENWLPLPDGPCLALLRQFFYDWENEGPATLFIEREGAEYPPPAMPADGVGAGMRRFAAFLKQAPVMFSIAAQQHYGAPPGTVHFPPIDLGLDRDHTDQFAHNDQFYGQGAYECTEDEAVILEVHPPECEYWSVSLVTQYWESQDWFTRQTSINGHQARLDADGGFRAVISHRDPGAPNWLDAGGREVGLIATRFFAADGPPEVTMRVVKIAKLDQELPADTPAVSVEERRDLLRRRALVMQRRGMI